MLQPPAVDLRGDDLCLRGSTNRLPDLPSRPVPDPPPGAQQFPFSPEILPERQAVVPGHPADRIPPLPDSGPPGR